MVIMVLRVDVSPALIKWAIERSGIDRGALQRRFAKLAAWESGSSSPTLRQVEEFAKVTHTPTGFLFLSEPPVETVPIRDFRTSAGATTARPSPDLLDTIYACQQRQEWFHDYARANRFDPVSFVGSCTIDTPVDVAASEMRDVLGFAVDNRGATWTEALVRLSEHAEDAGVLVMVNGVVGSNTHRRLDPREFRGFTLVDPLAPVIFINGADTKAAQIFTLAHELAHVWLGETGLDDVSPSPRSADATERWCNRVAAEFLVPTDALHQAVRASDNLIASLDRLAHVFKVSTLVILRRLHEISLMTEEDFRDTYDDELERVLDLAAQRTGTGGNFYNTQPVRVSKLFARSILASTLEGHTLHRDAFRLLGFKRQATFDELTHRLGVA